MHRRCIGRFRFLVPAPSHETCALRKTAATRECNAVGGHRGTPPRQPRSWRMPHAIIERLSRPIQIIGDGLELRRLCRQLPSVHRRLIHAPGGIRRETDAEYLLRLREIHHERTATHTRSTQTG